MAVVVEGLLPPRPHALFFFFWVPHGPGGLSPAAVALRVQLPPQIHQECAVLGAGRTAGTSLGAPGAAS